MQIEDLDEFDGLTVDMVRAWLRAKGFTLKQTERWSVWVRGAEAVHDHLLTETVTLEYLASTVAQCSLQSLLREINPRMRAGLPSSSAVRAHESGEGWWCAQTPGGILRYGKFTPMLCFTVEALHGRQTANPHEVATWCFWPCDAHGNKTRRGA